MRRFLLLIGIVLGGSVGAVCDMAHGGTREGRQAASQYRQASADSIVAGVPGAEPDPSPSQRDIMDVLRQWISGRSVEPRGEGPIQQRFSWSILPTMSYNPVYGFAFGAAATGAGLRASGP